MSYKLEKDRALHMKMGKKPEKRSFTKEKLLVANDDLKSYSISSVVRKTETKILPRYHYVPARMVALKSLGSPCR